ncbi:MAG: hypothetical protein AAF714_09350 [Pseudomonadota bacterium]
MALLGGVVASLMVLGLAAVRWVTIKRDAPPMRPVHAFAVGAAILVLLLSLGICFLLVQLSGSIFPPPPFGSLVLNASAVLLGGGPVVLLWVAIMAARYESLLANAEVQHER